MMVCDNLWIDGHTVTPHIVRLRTFDDSFLQHQSLTSRIYHSSSIEILPNTSSTFSLELVQCSGKPLHCIKKIPDNGGSLDQIFLPEELQNIQNSIPDISLLREIQWIASPQKEGSKNISWWLLNTQEVLTCAINGVLLNPNNKQTIADGDNIQIGSLLFRARTKEETNLSSTINTSHNSSGISNDISLDATHRLNSAKSSASKISPPPLSLSNFKLEDLDRMLSDSSTDQSLDRISVEKIELTSSSSEEHTQSSLDNQEKIQQSIPRAHTAGEENLINSLHREYLEVLQDPRLLASQKIFFAQKKKF